MQHCANAATKASLLRASLGISAQHGIKRLFFCEGSKAKLQLFPTFAATLHFALLSVSET